MIFHVFPFCGQKKTFPAKGKVYKTEKENNEPSEKALVGRSFCIWRIPLLRMVLSPFPSIIFLDYILAYKRKSCQYFVSHSGVKRFCFYFFDF